MRQTYPNFNVQSKPSLILAVCVCRCVEVCEWERAKARKWLTVRGTYFNDENGWKVWSPGVSCHMEALRCNVHLRVTLHALVTVISVCSGCSSKQWVSDKNVSAEQRSEDNKTWKIRYVVLAAVDPDLIKIFLFVFFYSLYFNIFFLLIFMWSLYFCASPDVFLSLWRW